MRLHVAEAGEGVGALLLEFFRRGVRARSAERSSGLRASGAAAVHRRCHRVSPEAAGVEFFGDRQRWEEPRDVARELAAMLAAAAEPASSGC